MLRPAPKQPQKSSRNICYWSARTGGEGTTGSETMIAADVSLVASGVGKGCTEDNLREFLVGKGINPVEVELLTREEIMNDVRTITFRVAVKAADYEAALKPEVWPYRVAVRHYRAQTRDRRTGGWQAQAERSGGQIDRQSGTGQQGNGAVPRRQIGRQYLPTGYANPSRQNKQMMGPMQPGPVELSNIYSILSALGGEIPCTNQ